MLNSSDRMTRSRTNLYYTLLIIAVLVIFAVGLTTYMSRSLEKRTEDELTQKVVLLVNTMSSYHEALSESAIKISNVFQAHFSEDFSIDPGKVIPIEGKQTPIVKNGSIVLNLNNSIVDHFTTVTKAVGTVFVRSDDDFIRVCTSLKKEDGSRAIGTILDRNHPAYRGLLQGIGYVGKTELFGKDYMTSYQPVKDSKGNVIAALFIGMDFTDNLKGLKDKIRNTKIGKSGYIYVLDAKEGRDYGKLQIHPFKEGTNFLDFKDAYGNAFVRKILEKKDGTIRYYWINEELGETKAREKLIAYRTLKEWNWTICAGAWVEELNKEAQTLKNAMIGATALLACALILLFRNMLRIENRYADELKLRIDEYQSTHDQLLATEEMLRVQLDVAKESSQKFKAVFNNSPVTVALTTIPEGCFYEVNQAFIEMFGYSTEEILGKTTTDLALWQNDEERCRFVQLLKETDFVRNFEATMRCKGDKEITVLISGASIEIADKRCVLSAILDITEQKRLQNQLHQSQKMDVVGQLAGGMAHDFNNMLTGIMGAAELLKFRLADDAKMHKLIDTIIEAASRSADLTRELLTFSRKGPGASNPVQIHDAIASVMSLLERTIDKQIKLTAHLDADNPVVVGDKTQLQNALLNLGINARDAMPNGGALTYSTIERMLDTASSQSMGVSLAPGNYLAISVSDTGVGMTKAVMERIFEPFFTTKEVDKGTGLGLAAVYGAVKNHGGEIWVQSHPGNGSVFTIFLPMVPIESGSVHIDAKTITGCGGILLVDDEDMLRTVGRELLEELGYTLYLAENGEHALEVFAAHRDEISLVILDMIMPQMGGAEAFLKLREQSPGLKILFCSGFSHTETGDELIGMGACGFIQKPYNRIELSQAVAKALSQA